MDNINGCNFFPFVFNFACTFYLNSANAFYDTHYITSDVPFEMFSFNIKNLSRSKVIQKTVIKSRGWHSSFLWIIFFCIAESWKTLPLNAILVMVEIILKHKRDVKCSKDTLVKQMLVLVIFFCSIKFFKTKFDKSSLLCYFAFSTVFWIRIFLLRTKVLTTQNLLELLSLNDSINFLKFERPGNFQYL